MRQSRLAIVYYLEEFGFASAAHIERLGSVRIEITIDLGPFPATRQLAPYAPAERSRRIRSHFRQLFDRLRLVLPEAAKPTDAGQCVCTVPARVLRTLRRHPSVQSVWLNRVEGRQRRKIRRRNLEWYAVLARFAIQVEGQTRGTQDYEDRIVIVQAYNLDDAPRRLRAEFKRYATPYLGATNRLVRWQFEEVLDVYSMGQVNFSEKAIEVFSTLKSRRLRPRDAWIPQRPPLH